MFKSWSIFQHRVGLKTMQDTGGKHKHFWTLRLQEGIPYAGPTMNASRPSVRRELHPGALTESVSRRKDMELNQLQINNARDTPALVYVLSLL